MFKRYIKNTWSYMKFTGFIAIITISDYRLVSGILFAYFFFHAFSLEFISHLESKNEEGEGEEKKCSRAPIVIDDLVKKGTSFTEELSATVDGQEVKGWMIAKPINYDLQYLSLEDRQAMAKDVLEGRAIAVKYFQDLSEEERSQYVKNKV